MAYASQEEQTISKHPDVHSYITDNFPPSTQSALRLLPIHILSYIPLYELLEGFKTDLKFHGSASEKTRVFPIKSEYDLERYATRVAGTVAELCLELVFYHMSETVSISHREDLVRSGGRMGTALQYVNISRDIKRDAVMGRVYIPTSWLKEEGLEPEDVIENPDGPSIDRLRGKLLQNAFDLYQEAQFAITQIPADARPAMRVAVESYMEIGRVLREKGFKVRNGRATVPTMRRIRVAWNALSEV